MAHYFVRNFICESFWCFQELKWQKISSASAECPGSLARSLQSGCSELLVPGGSRNGLVYTSLVSSSPDPFCFLASESYSRHAEGLDGTLHLSGPLFSALWFYRSSCHSGSQTAICSCHLGRCQAVFSLPPCVLCPEIVSILQAEFVGGLPSSFSFPHSARNRNKGVIYITQFSLSMKWAVLLSVPCSRHF